jgi:hypothetical protein
MFYAGSFISEFEFAGLLFPVLPGWKVRRGLMPVHLTQELRAEILMA